MGNRTLIYVLGAIGLGAMALFATVVLFYTGDVFVLIGSIIGFLVLLITSLFGLRTATEAKQQGAENAVEVKKVHEIVNSQRTEMTEHIRRLEAEVAAMRQEKAIIASEAAHADDGLSRIATAIESVVPPKEPNPSEP